MKPKPVQWADTVVFVPPITKGQCIKVYDGDTITIATKLPYKDSPMYRFSVRLAGIDAAEIKDKSDLALKAKEKLSEFVLGKEVTLENVETEKYGRLLATVYVNKTNVNQWLLDQKLVISYNGGKKDATAFENIKL